jgi:hypothetical protein
MRRAPSARVHLRNLMVTERIGEDVVKEGTTTGLAVGQSVYFKPGGGEEFTLAKVEKIMVGNDRNNKYSKIIVELKPDSKDAEVISVEFDPSRFMLEEATDPDKSVNIPLIYRPDLGPDLNPVLWVPPKVQAEFRVARRVAKRSTTKGGKQSGAKDTVRPNPGE